MTFPISIYTETRPIWELRLLHAIERTLIEAAKTQPDPADYLHSAYAVYDASGWEPALAMTLPHVPKEFRHLWTIDRARDLMESAFIIPMMKLDRQSRGRFMRECIIPALERAGCTVKVRP
ncbi:hypothetical protein [Roseovarius sp.]|uniref:hypothetical protein n=1 Tax=Roseovarius sp. TaxID=1486281 RepID=UPI003567FB0E